ncbi:GxxExxY protein [candidate division KSB1 bacterium]|nr:GxxExxY protein [candidate division KSB1 bacterium]
MNSQGPKNIEKSNELSHRIIGAAIEVHRHLGPGLLKSAYEESLCHEFKLQEIPFERQKPLPITYKGIKLDCDYKVNILVDKLVIVEVTAVEEIAPIHEAHVLTYLKLSGLWLGLLINFNVEVLKDGIHRIVN